MDYVAIVKGKSANYLGSITAEYCQAS